MFASGPLPGDPERILLCGILSGYPTLAENMLEMFVNHMQ